MDRRSFVIGTAAATAAVEGLAAIISKVSIQGPLTGYAPLTPINNCSGGMLAEMAQFIRSNVSYSFGSLAATGASASGADGPATNIAVAKGRSVWKAISVGERSRTKSSGFSTAAPKRPRLRF